MTVREFFKNISYCQSGLPDSSGWVSSCFSIARKSLSVFFDLKRFTIYWLIFSVFPSQVFAAAGDVISNTATVNYSILAVPFTQESSPTGNTVQGVGNGTPTTFRHIMPTQCTLNACPTSLSALRLGSKQ